MRQMRLQYPISLLSRILRVSASGFYAWINRPPSEWANDEIRLEVAIKAAHRRTRQTYGAERLQHELAEDGIRVGICRIKRIKRKLSLRCKQKRKFKVTTDSKHKLPVAEWDRMAIVDTKAFMLPPVLHSTFGHKPQVIRIPV
jgi:putative transposase